MKKIEAVTEKNSICAVDENGHLNKTTFAHSPDCDDAFMFYGIASGGIDTGEFEVEQVAKDIETLNNEAKEGRYDITAISFASYPYIADRYLLMPCGASFGLKYGPVVVARNHMDPQSLAGATIAIPGYMTTAYLLLRLYAGLVKVVVLPFQDIISAVMNAEVEAGLIIHEGQLTYEQMGLKKIVDLGQWWYQTTKLPLPLGANAIKRDLGEKKIVELSRIVRQSIEYAIANRDEALRYAMHLAGNTDKNLADRYVRMYVNELSVDCGQPGQEAAKKLFQLAVQKQVIDGEFLPPFV
jgi:1,4-dihydroxy-6-naphthoate synthase